MAHILVVEDEIAIAEILLALFEDEGHSVQLAPHGQAGFDAVAGQRPDLVLTDTTMPVMTGPEMVAALLDHPDLASIPVVVMSALPEAEVRSTYIRCATFIQKPFRLHEVAATVASILAAITTKSPPVV